METSQRILEAKVKLSDFMNLHRRMIDLKNKLAKK